jgi:tetratricopeptide (TPR) repeat protein
VTGWQRIHLDEIPELPGPDTLTWKPVRMALDLRAFGTNAYTATEAGADVVEPHTESAVHAHEELYFVHTGSARVTLDGESFDAPAGTYVRVTDTAVHRHAVALEPGTTVLSFGGPRTFTPSGWEWGFRAEAARKAGDIEAARAILDELATVDPDSPGVRWWRTRLYLSEGDEDAALESLRDALDRQPELRQDALDDPELGALVSRLPETKEE